MKSSAAPPPFLLVGSVVWLITVMLWWGFAFLPLPATAPLWVERARTVCFALADNGLPRGYGWIMLVGAPLMMGSALGVMWGDEWRAVRNFFARQHVVALLCALLVSGLALEAHLIGKRITSMVLRPQTVVFAASEGDVDLSMYPRQHRNAPDFSLLDETGQRITLASAQGKILYLTFAFAHCRAVCPLLAEQLRQVHAALGAERAAIFIVSLDPWRDTTGALAQMHAQWELSPEMHLLSGNIDSVNAVLDAYQVPRTRDLQSGDLVHPALVDVIDTHGQLAYTFNAASTALLIQAGRALMNAQ